MRRTAWRKILHDRAVTGFDAAHDLWLVQGSAVGERA